MKESMIFHTLAVLLSAVWLYSAFDVTANWEEILVELPSLQNLLTLMGIPFTFYVLWTKSADLLNQRI